MDSDISALVELVSVVNERWASWDNARSEARRVFERKQ